MVLFNLDNENFLNLSLKVLQMRGFYSISLSLNFNIGYIVFLLDINNIGSESVKNSRKIILMHYNST